MLVLKPVSSECFHDTTYHQLLYLLLVGLCSKGKESPRSERSFIVKREEFCGGILHMMGFFKKLFPEEYLP